MKLDEITTKMSAGGENKVRDQGRMLIFRAQEDKKKIAKNIGESLRCFKKS